MRHARVRQYKYIRRCENLCLVYSLPFTQGCCSAYTLHTIVYPCDYSLHWTARWCQWDLVTALIAVGSNINFIVEGMSVFDWIIVGLISVKSPRKALLELAISAGADPDCLSDFAIESISQWPSDTSKCLTEKWSAETLERVKQLKRVPSQHRIN